MWQCKLNDNYFHNNYDDEGGIFVNLFLIFLQLLFNYQNEDQLRRQAEDGGIDTEGDKDDLISRIAAVKRKAEEDEDDENEGGGRGSDSKDKKMKISGNIGIQSFK